MWQRQITDAIDDAIEKGFILVLIGPETFESQAMAAEVEYALRRSAELGAGAILPIFVDVGMDAFTMLEELGLITRNVVLFSTGDFEDNFARLLAHLARFG